MKKLDNVWDLNSLNNIRISDIYYTVFILLFRFKYKNCQNSKNYLYIGMRCYYIVRRKYRFHLLNLNFFLFEQEKLILSLKKYRR